MTWKFQNRTNCNAISYEISHVFLKLRGRSSENRTRHKQRDASFRVCEVSRVVRDYIRGWTSCRIGNKYGSSRQFRVSYTCAGRGRYDVGRWSFSHRVGSDKASLSRGSPLCDLVGRCLSRRWRGRGDRAFSVGPGGYSSLPRKASSAHKWDTSNPLGGLASYI